MSLRRSFGARLGVAVVALAAADVASPCGDERGWPQWRGPDQNGISQESGWSVDGVELWARDVGLGYSCVSIAGGRLFTLGHDEDEGRDVAWCLDPRTGRTLWTHSWPAEKWDLYHGGGTQTTPAVAGELVYVAEREGKLFCLAAATGAVRWSRDTVAELGVRPPTWGFSASPLVLGRALVLNLGRTLALERDTGEVLWRSADYGDAYSTPAAFALDGRPCLAVLAGDGLVVLDRRDGSALWRRAWKTRYDVNAATPIVLGNRVFVSSGYGHGCALLELCPGGVDVVWESKAMQNQMATSVLFEGHLYGFDDSELECVDLAGVERWRKRGLGKGALSIAGSRLVVLTSRGELVVADASPERFQELSRAKVLDGGECWTAPVVHDGLIYCRNSKGRLVCRDHNGARAR